MKAVRCADINVAVAAQSCITDYVLLPLSLRVSHCAIHRREDHGHRSDLSGLLRYDRSSQSEKLLLMSLILIIERHVSLHIACAYSAVGDMPNDHQQQDHRAESSRRLCDTGGADHCSDISINPLLHHMRCYGHGVDCVFRNLHSQPVPVSSCHGIWLKFAPCSRL